MMENNKYFSIILPTRKRPKQLQLVIDSILETTHYTNKLEICLIVDTDDKTEYTSSNNIKIYSRERGKDLVNDYFNWVIPYTTGQYILAINDDCLFRTYDWDRFCLSKLEEFNSKVVLGVPNDGEKYTDRIQYKFPVTNFPIISKEGINRFGYFFNPEFESAGAELDIIKKYWDMNCVVNLRDICLIQHKLEEFKDLKENIENHIDLIN